MVSEVGEMLIKIAFQVDPKGAAEAVKKLNDVGDAAKKAGKNTEEARKHVRTFNEELKSSARMLSVSGFALSNMAMTLQATGAISQDTAKTFAVAGSAMVGVGSAMRVAHAASMAFKNGLTGINQAFIVGAAAVASYTITYSYLDEQWQKSTGHFTNLQTALKAKTFKEAATQVLKFTQVTAAEDQAIQALTNEMIKQEPRLGTWYRLTLDIKDATKNLIKEEEKLSKLNTKIGDLSSDYSKWKQAVKDVADAQEIQEDSARSLRRAQMDLNDLLNEGTDIEKKWAAAQNLYKTGHMKASDYARARSEYDRYKLSIEEARDAIDDQGRASKENSDQMKDAQGVIGEMQKKYPGLGYADLKPLIDAAVASQKTMVTDLETSRTHLDKMREDEEAMAKELGPELTSTFLALKNPTGEVRQAMLDIQKAQQATLDAAQQLYNIYDAMGKLPFIGGILQGIIQRQYEMTGTGVPGVTSPSKSTAVGDPYVSRDMNVRVHKGEAIIPANQNSYNDNISIKNLTLSRGYGMDAFMKDRDKAIRIKRKMLGYT